MLLSCTRFFDMYIKPLKRIHIMKKTIFGILRAFVAIVLMLLAVSVWISTLTVVGVFIAVLLLCFFAIMLFPLLYNLIVKSKK